jgi:hypothetical protein
MLETKFTLTVARKSISAIAVSSSTCPFLIALYAILVQFLFIGLWRIISYLILVTMDISTQLNMLGVVAFWNSSDPLAALSSSSSFLWPVLPRGKHNGTQTANRVMQAFSMTMISLIILIASIVVSIIYPNALKLAQAAPVHPASVFWPRVDEVGNATVSEVLTYGRLGVLRAIGSAEAADDYHSTLKSIHFKAGAISSGENESQPQQEITYNYPLTSEDLGL